MDSTIARDELRKIDAWWRAANYLSVGQIYLYVDDDRVTREALTKLLAMFGYDTCPVGTVAEGVAKLDGQHCAIVDLNLPDGVGTYILQRINEEKRTMRVAVCTGTTDESLVTKAQAFRAEVRAGDGAGRGRVPGRVPRPRAVPPPGGEDRRRPGPLPVARARAGRLSTSRA
jgi:CheY-like chemotaxis protein